MRANVCYGERKVTDPLEFKENRAMTSLHTIRTGSPYTHTIEAVVHLIIRATGLCAHEDAHACAWRRRNPHQNITDDRPTECRHARFLKGSQWGSRPHTKWPASSLFMYSLFLAKTANDMRSFYFTRAFQFPMMNEIHEIRPFGILPSNG